MNELKIYKGCQDIQTGGCTASDICVFIVDSYPISVQSLEDVGLELHEIPEDLRESDENAAAVEITSEADFERYLELRFDGDWAVEPLLTRSLNGEVGNSAML